MDSRGGHTTWTQTKSKKLDISNTGSILRSLSVRLPHLSVCQSVQVERRSQPPFSAQPGGEMTETPPGEVEMILPQLLRRHARLHRHEEWIARD